MGQEVEKNLKRIVAGGQRNIWRQILGILLVGLTTYFVLHGELHGLYGWIAIIILFAFLLLSFWRDRRDFGRRDFGQVE